MDSISYISASMNIAFCRESSDTIRMYDLHLAQRSTRRNLKRESDILILIYFQVF